MSVGGVVGVLGVVLKGDRLGFRGWRLDLVKCVLLLKLGVLRVLLRWVLSRDWDSEAGDGWVWECVARFLCRPCR